ncbi:hypothetical protein AAVH_01820 [Aphelenchoides avenae]|nr:hypothetical protein AAVH_01820 [Aphelenchus avenae]
MSEDAYEEKYEAQTEQIIVDGEDPANGVHHVEEVRSESRNQTIGHVPVLRNVDDIYSTDPIQINTAADLVFNVNGCVDTTRLCEDCPWCPPDSDRPAQFVYVMDANRVPDIAELSNDGLCPWNSKNETCKATTRIRAVDFAADGSLILQGMKPDRSYTCILRQYYARNPREQNLIKRVFYAVNHPMDKEPRPDTFVVFVYEFLEGTRLQPLTYRSTRYNGHLRRPIMAWRGSDAAGQKRVATPSSKAQRQFAHLDLPTGSPSTSAASAHDNGYVVYEMVEDGSPPRKVVRALTSGRQSAQRTTQDGVLEAALEQLAEFSRMDEFGHIGYQVAVMLREMNSKDPVFTCRKVRELQDWLYNQKEFLLTAGTEIVDIDGTSDL